MTQRHFEQQGIFHVTTNARGKIPWLTWQGVPEILMDNLWMTRNIHGAEVYAFCVLPDHMHVVMKPGERGLSRFMHSFKRNAMRDLRSFRSGRSLSSAMETIAWQKSFHDEKIETDSQRENVLAYVRCNAWKHGFVQDPNDWRWSSLKYPHLINAVQIW